MAEKLSCPNCGKPYQIGDEVCRYCGLVFPFSTVVIAAGHILQGRYEIQELIHTGGMGYIYSAKDKRLYDRPCIVKQVRESIKSESHQKKLEEEALSMTKLTNPNIAMIFDHFVEGGYYFLVVERIAGKTLGEVLKERQGKFTEKEVLDWSVTICDVVGYLHSKGVIHRDISPDNIMLTEDNTIKFIDFGTSHEFRYYGSGGTVGIGKYGYTPPEQWRGKPEQRSDIFALGATIYYLLTGFLPLSHAYSTGQAPQKEDFNPEFPPIRTRNPKISARLEAALQKALQLDIEKRYATAAEFGQALKSLEKGKREKTARPEKVARPEKIAAPAGIVKGIARSGWFWAGIALSLIAIVFLIILAFGTVDKRTSPERIDMYWAMLIGCLPLAIGAFCLGWSLSRGRPAKRAWLWSGGASLLVEAVLLFFLAGNFVALTGRTTNQEESLILFTLLAGGAPYLALSIFCFVRGMKPGGQPVPVQQPAQKPGRSARAWAGHLVSATGLVLLIAWALTTSQQNTEAGRHGLILFMLLFCVPVLIIGNCFLGMGLARRQLAKRRWFQWGGGLVSIGLVLGIILMLCFTSIGVSNQERAFLLLIVLGAGASYLVLAIYSFIKGRRQGATPQTAPPAGRRAAPWIITGVSLVVAFWGIAWITGAVTDTPFSPGTTGKQTSQTTTPVTTTPATTTPTPLTAMEIVKNLKFESGGAVFDKDVVNGNEIFNVTIAGKITCTADISQPITEIYMNFETIAGRTGGGAEITLNSTNDIKFALSLKDQGNYHPFKEQLQLQFPEQAEQGDYQIIMRNKKVQINAGGWLDITSYLPGEQTLGTVTYFPAAAASYNYVEGYVYDAASNAPISGAKVEVVNTTESGGIPYEEVVAAVLSDSTGHFKTQKFVNAGPLKVRASVSGYQTGWLGNTSDKANATEVTFKSGGETLNIKIFLQRSGSISGRVTADADGRGIANVNISASDYASNQWIAAANTGSDGTYTISNLPSGTYRVYASASINGLPYVNEYYDNTYDYSLSQEIEITAGQNLSGINLSLAAGGSISGKIVADADGNGISNLQVHIYQSITNRWINAANTNSDGTYTVSNLPAGAYSVRATPFDSTRLFAAEYYGNTYNWMEATAVTVAAGQNVSGINFSLAPGGTISGTVRNAGGSAPLAGILVEYFKIVDNQWEGAGTSTDSQGRYNFYGVPYGQFFVRARGNTLDYVLEYYPEKTRQSLATLLTVGAGANPAGIDFTLESGGTISGKVISETTYEGIYAVHVWVADYTTGEWIAGDFTRADGTYTIHGLPAGSFRVMAMPSWSQLPYVDEYYKDTTNHNQATPVSVTVGKDTPGINFALASRSYSAAYSGHAAGLAPPVCLSSYLKDIEYHRDVELRLY